MPRGQDAETSRHRFEDRVRNAFLVLVGRRFTRVEKRMRAAVKFEQFLLGKKAAKMDFAHNPKFLRQLFEVRLKRSLARDDQLCVWKFLLENGKRAERSGHALFRDQPAGLHETPAAVSRRIATNEGKFMKQNAGATDA